MVEASANDEVYGVDVMGEASAVDLCKEAFKSYSDANFKQCKEQLEQLKKCQESVSSQVSAASMMQLEEDNMTHIRQNMLLCDYYEQKGQFPQKYLYDLQKLASQQMHVNLEPAPKCQISQDGTQILLGDWANAPGNASGDQKKNYSSINKGLSSTNNALSNAINSNLNGAGGPSVKTNLSPEEVFLNSVRQGDSAQNPGSLPTQQSHNVSSLHGGVVDSTDTAGQSSGDGGAGAHGGANSTGASQSTEAINFNSVLLYNCAAMSFQTQHFGQCLGYLNMTMKHLEKVETVVQVKTLFLLLQTLYELRQCEPAQPIIFLLEVKLEEQKYIIEQKTQIKDTQSQNSTMADSVTETTSQADNEEESKSSSQWRLPCMESIEENVVSKNSFCIMVGAYLREHAVSPKSVNIQEYEMLLNSFKALFKLLQRDNKGAAKCFEKAKQNKDNLSNDAAQFNERMRKPAYLQAQGFYAHLGANIALDCGKDGKAVQILYQYDKDVVSTKDSKQSSSVTNPWTFHHKSCQSSKKRDEISKNDMMYQKCKQLHPQFYFNNLGILHLRLRKYRLAAFQFTKALKFLEVAQNVTIQVPQAAGSNQSNQVKETQLQVIGDGYSQPFAAAAEPSSKGGKGADRQAAEPADTTPHEYITSLNSQRAAEILYNFGLALFKEKKYFQAFKNFEKASNALRGNPKLWYYLGLSVMHLNKQLEQQMNAKQHSGTYQKEYGNHNENFEKTNNFTQLNRIQLAPKGDNLQRLQSLVAEQENEYLTKLQKQQAEIIKNLKSSTTENISKAKIKRQEKLVQTAWQQANLPKGSMQLDNAIMYLQNTLVTIQNEIGNEQRYTLLYKFVAKAHINSMQMSYNEAVAKSGDDDSTAASKSTTHAANQEESKHQFGTEGYKYPSLEFPSTFEDLNSYNSSVKGRIEKKYETLMKNVHFYLCYLFLETGDYRNAIKHGQTMLNTFEGRLLKKTQFTVMQYLAEAHCMLGEHSHALEVLDEAQKLMEEGRSRSEEDLKLTVEMLTTKLIHGDKLSTKTIVQMNKAAIMLCQGDLVAAKNQLDELLEDQNLRVIQTDPNQNELIPDYLVNLLVYFLMVTKNLKMARHLTKYRRFMLDTNHIEATVTNGSPSAGGSQATNINSSGLSSSAADQVSSGAASDSTGKGNTGRPARKTNRTYISSIKDFR